jgi:hypothetical protein
MMDRACLCVSGVNNIRKWIQEEQQQQQQQLSGAGLKQTHCGWSPQLHVTNLYVAVLGDDLLDLPVDVCIVPICKVGVGCQLLQRGQCSLPTAAAGAAAVAAAQSLPQWKVYMHHRSWKVARVDLENPVSAHLALTPLCTCQAVPEVLLEVWDDVLGVSKLIRVNLHRIPLQ